MVSPGPAATDVPAGLKRSMRGPRLPVTPLNVVVVFSPFFPANLKHRTCPIVEIELAFDAPCLIKVGHRTGLVSSWFEMSKVSVSPAMSAYSRRLCVPVSLKVHSSVPSSALPQGSDPFGAPRGTKGNVKG